MNHEITLSRVWPEPESLPTSLPEVQSFEPELLPEPMRSYVMDCSDRMNCPPDFVAVGSLSSFSSLVGRQLAVRPKQRDDWEVTPNLWGALIGTPSSRKSPAINAALTQLKALDSVSSSLYIKAMAEFESEKMAFDLAVTGAKQTVTKSLKQDPSMLGQRQARGELDSVLAGRPEPPIRRAYVTQDATIEKLGELIAENPNGILVERDELTGWMSDLDRPGREGSRGFYLEAWNGNAPYRVDRIGRGTIEIPALCATVFGGIQPDRLRKYFRSAINGSADDGLLARFQLLVWPDPIKPRSLDRRPDADVKSAMEELFRWVDVLPLDQLGVIRDSERVPYIRFSSDASDCFMCWELALREKAANENPAIEAHLCKYPSLVASLALLFHLMERRSGRVDSDSVERAIGWACYLESHARRIYSPVVDSAMDSAIKLAKKISEGKLQDGFSLRDVYRNNWSGLKNKDQLNDAVQLLIEHGWLREEEILTSSRRGRPTGSTFTINPNLSICDDAQAKQ